MKTRCAWAEGNPYNEVYHDTKWGVPVHDDRILFEMIILDSMQAGLSWLTILKKYDNFMRAFDGFDPLKVADYDDQKVQELLNDEGIIRNRLKIAAAIQNAKAFLNVQNEFGTFDRYIWGFVGGRSIKNQVKDIHEIPVKTKEAEVMSKDLVARGFKFVGPTICYAFMQAAGLVNDHEVKCFRYNEVEI